MVQSVSPAKSVSKQSRFWICISMATALLPALAVADVSPAGLWTTFDDDTGRPSGTVEITHVDGKLQGRVVDVVVEPGEDSNPTCKECAGERKNLPIRGMVILWDVVGHDADYSGGEILDPDDGKIYRCRLHLREDGDTLEVRGYVGVSLFGRTQIWRRVKTQELSQKTSPKPK